MKPIEKLKKAIKDYEEETETIINRLQTIDRVIVDSKTERQSIDFKIELEAESLN